MYEEGRGIQALNKKGRLAIPLVFSRRKPEASAGLIVHKA